MAQRVLDHARRSFSSSDARPVVASDMLDAIKESVELLDASPVEGVTACAYLCLSLKDEREARNDSKWPQDSHGANRLLGLAAVYAEQYERGSVCNELV